MLRQGVACRGAPQPTCCNDCVTRAGRAQAPRAGRVQVALRSRAHSLVMLTMLAPVVENRTVHWAGGPRGT